jgi:hypothetical protein
MSNNSLQVDPNIVNQVWKEKNEAMTAENVLLTAAVSQLGTELATTQAELKRVQGELDSLNDAED